ncbi:hypothetical protein CHU98_g8178 [Xylaria longipes]|nr:hypothetical protein CHU98_g8178 [Xylaria longipes]
MAGAAPESRGLLGLPVELSMKVLSFTLLNSSKDVINLATSCKALHNIFMNHQTSIFRPFLSQMDPRELAIATAHYHATIAPWTYPKDLDVPVLQDQRDYLSKITDFCDQYLSKQGTELRISFQEFTLPMVAHIQDIHLAIRRITVLLGMSIESAQVEVMTKAIIRKLKSLEALYLMDFSEDPYTRFMLWKGMKELDPIIHDGFSEEDERLLSSIRTDPRFKSISRKTAQCLAYWFEGPELHHVFIDFKVLERYDADIDNASARASLCQYAGLTIRGKQRRRRSTLLSRMVDNLLEDSYIFYSIDHLLATTDGHLPTLEHLVRCIGRKAVDMALADWLEIPYA